MMADSMSLAKLFLLPGLGADNRCGFAVQIRRINNNALPEPLLPGAYP